MDLEYLGKTINVPEEFKESLNDLAEEKEIADYAADYFMKKSKKFNDKIEAMLRNVIPELKYSEKIIYNNSEKTVSVISLVKREYK